MPWTRTRIEAPSWRMPSSSAIVSVAWHCLDWPDPRADLKGFATFHGGLKTLEGQNYTKTRGEFLIMNGSSDTAITIDQFAALAKELESAGVAHEMITYGGAQHTFTVFSGDRYQGKG